MNNKREEIQATIEKMRQQNRHQQQSHSHLVDTELSVELSSKQRASSNHNALSIPARKAAMQHLIKQLLLGEISQGNALKQFRVNILGLKQDAYAKLVSVSRKTLSDVENDKGNYSIEIINRMYKPFGLQMGLMPVNKNLLITLLSS